MLQPNEFKIYNASAGAGKTYTLVKEYLSILLSSQNPFTFESILAITFTNKAANEMKERILQQLLNFSKPDFQSNSDLQNLSSELNLNPETIHDRSREILRKILHNYSRFSVSTIDKFNLRLMKSFAQDLNLSSNFNVEMDLDAMLEESVNQLYSKMGDDEILTSVLLGIALDNLNENRSWDITRDLVQHSKIIYSDTHAENLKQLQKYSLEEFNELRKIVFRKTAQKKNKLIQNANDFFDLIRNLGISAGDFAGGPSGIPGYFRKFIHDDFSYPTNTHLKNIENTDPKKFTSAKADSSLNSVIENIFPQIQSLFYDSVQVQKDLPLWLGIQKTIVTLSVLNEVEKTLAELKNDNNILLISEFNKIISENLQNQPSGFIYERIGNRFHHYFIDEFQDTSKLQWLNLKPLIENARASSDTIMLVGDPKQSIYRWRGGNPDLMLNLIQSKKEQNINLENLPTNWRSHQKIIEFNNEFYTYFSGQLSTEIYQNIYKNGNNQSFNSKSGGYVQLNFVENKTKEEYEDFTLNQILENIKTIHQQGFRNKEIAILHRTKKDGKLIADFLAENGIDIISNESLLLSNSPEIQLLELFMKTAANPEDLISKAAFLLKFKEINQIDNLDYTAEIQNIIKKDFVHLVEFLARFGVDISFVLHPNLSLYEFTENAVKNFRLGQNGNSYIIAFLDFVLEFSVQNEYNLQRFLEFWNEKNEKLSISVPDGIDAVHLMTIHKAKGLEFQVVILPFADWGKTQKSPKFWIPVEDEEVQFNEFLMDSYQNENLAEVSPEIKTIIEREKAEFEIENLNLLYVATTRAVEQLYIVTEKLKDKKEKSKAVSQYFNDFAKIHLRTSESEISVKGKKTRISEVKNDLLINEKIPFHIENWREKIRISKESSKRWMKSKSIVYGELIHELMALVETENDIENAIENALISGLIKESEKSEIQNLMHQIAQHVELKKYFQPDLKILNERDFMDENGEIFRPDRIVLNGNSCTIIDYKTGGELSKHVAQIHYYAENLKKTGFEIENKFLVYANEEILVKEVN